MLMIEATEIFNLKTTHGHNLMDKTSSCGVFLSVNAWEATGTVHSFTISDLYKMIQNSGWVCTFRNRIFVLQ